MNPFAVKGMEMQAWRKADLRTWQGKGREWKHWNSSSDCHTRPCVNSLPCVKFAASGALHDLTRSAWRSVKRHKRDGVGGRGRLKRRGCISISIYNHGQFTLLSGRNQQNIAKAITFQLKKRTCLPTGTGKWQKSKLNAFSSHFKKGHLC